MRWSVSHHDSNVSSTEHRQIWPDCEEADKRKRYLVVGAGLQCLAFVDEVLTQDKKATFVIVDRHPAPGGHWNKAYPFVTLHQPSAVYGVNSKTLGKKFSRRHGLRCVGPRILALSTLSELQRFHVTL